MISVYQIIKTISALVFVSALAVVLLRRWGHLLNGVGAQKASSDSKLKLLDRLALDAEHSLYVVELETGAQLLVSTAPGATVVHGELSEGSLVSAPNSQALPLKQIASLK